MNKLKRDRKQLNIFERKVYRRILGQVCDNEKENWTILTNKENYARVKKICYNRENKVNPSAWGHLNRSSYCDVGRLFYGVFKLRSKLQRKK